MSKQPAQWAIKQHIEKYPKCEWICMHTNLKNLAEEKEEPYDKDLEEVLLSTRTLQSEEQPHAN